MITIAVAPVACVVLQSSMALIWCLGGRGFAVRRKSGWGMVQQCWSWSVLNLPCLEVGLLASAGKGFRPPTCLVLCCCPAASCGNSGRLDKEGQRALKTYVPTLKLFKNKEELQKVVAWVEQVRSERQQKEGPSRELH